MAEQLTTPQGFKYTKLGRGKYRADMNWLYRSERYGLDVIINKGQIRDGATGAFDLESLAWWVHDQLCADGVWADGTDVTQEQAAQVLSDILDEEGRWFRRYTWKWATYFLGCHKAREND